MWSSSTFLRMLYSIFYRFYDVPFLHIRRAQFYFRCTVRFCTSFLVQCFYLICVIESHLSYLHPPESPLQYVAVYVVSRLPAFKWLSSLFTFTNFVILESQKGVKSSFYVLYWLTCLSSKLFVPLKVSYLFKISSPFLRRIYEQNGIRNVSSLNL